MPGSTQSDECLVTVRTNCRQRGSVGGVRTIGSGSVATQVQRQPRHSYVGTRMWPIRMGRTGWPFSSRHLGQMASNGGSGGIWLRRLDLVCLGRNRTFVLGENFPCNCSEAPSMQGLGPTSQINLSLRTHSIEKFDPTGADEADSMLDDAIRRRIAEATEQGARRARQQAGRTNHRLNARRWRRTRPPRPLPLFDQLPREDDAAHRLPRRAARVGRRP
jgi:hypothetical protein